MLNSNVRRLSAVVVLAAILCTASPALAAPVSRPVSPIILADGLLDQFLAWLGSLLPERQPQVQAPLEKVGPPVGGDVVTQPPKTDCHGMVDPNG